MSGMAASSKAIIHHRLTDLFAELACSSASMANALLERFPDYRVAKDNRRHPFWNRNAKAMMKAVMDADRDLELHRSDDIDRDIGSEYIAD